MDLGINQPLHLGKPQQPLEPVATPLRFLFRQIIS